MAFRPDIIAGQAVIVVRIQDQVDKQLRRIRTSFRRFSNEMSQLGGDLFRFGAVGSIGTFLPIKEFTEFQDQILFLQTKLQATEPQMNRLEGVIRKLGSTTSFTSVEVAKAATELAKAGFSIDETINTLQASLDLARSGQTEISTATTILSNTIRTFGVDADRAAIFASKFITAARKGTLDIVDLNESLKESSGTFRQLGVDIDKALGLITQISLSSLRATKAGTSLNTALTQIAAKANKFQDITGLPLTDADLENPVIAFTKLSEALSRLSKTQQADITRDLLNIRGARAVNAVLIQGLENQKALIDSIAESTDEARRSAEQLDSRLGGAFRKVRSAFQELQLSLGSVTEGPLVTVSQNLIKFFQDLSEVAKANPRLIQTLLIIPPAIVVVSASFLVFSSILARLASLLTPIIGLNNLFFSTLAQLVSGNEKLIRAIGGVLGKFKGIEIATKSLKSGWASLGNSVIPVLVREFNVARLAADRLSFKKPTAEVNNFGKAIRGAFAPNVTKNLIDTSIKVDRFRTSLSQPFLPGFGLFQPSLPFDTGPAQAPAKGLKTIVDDAVRTVNALINDPGQIKATPNTQARVAQALSDVLSSQNIPKQLTPQIEKAVNASLSTAKIAPQATQKLFDFVDSPAVARQLEFKFADGIQEAVRKAPRRLSLSAIRGNLAREVAAAAAARTQRQQPSTIARGFRAAISGTDRIIAGVVRAFSAIPTIFRAITNGLAGVIRQIVQFVRSGEALRKTIGFFRGFVAITKTLFTALNAFRRFAFTFSGFLTIVELLILFGPKIPPIARAFDALGEAFRGVGQQFKTLGSDLSPILSFLGDSIRRIFSGDSARGVEQFKLGLSLAADIIKTRLAAAWRGFLKDIEPFVQFVRGVFVTFIESIKLLVELIGNVFGAAFQSGAIILKGDGSLMDLLKSIFSGENVEKFFAAIGGALTSLANSILRIIQGIANSIDTMVGAVQQGMGAIQQAVGFTFRDREMRASGEAMSAFGAVRSEIALSGTSPIDEIVNDAIKDNNKALDKFLKNISGAFTDAVEELDEAAGNQAESAKARAQLEELFNIPRDIVRKLLPEARIAARTIGLDQLNFSRLFARSTREDVAVSGEVAESPLLTFFRDLPEVMRPDQIEAKVNEGVEILAESFFSTVSSGLEKLFGSNLVEKALIGRAASTITGAMAGSAGALQSTLIKPALDLEKKQLEVLEDIRDNTEDLNVNLGAFG